ncbi:MAG TPA: ABC transporter permease [Candidatus Baltobacteraceae bacterium]|jgi:ABC-2 type transport system permease protein|nr:ABC transporter permease [Candidatus Baltobacteraceae bacterium]
MIRLAFLYAKVQWLQLSRVPGFVVPTLLFPSLFFTLFDLNFARSHPKVAPFLMLGYVAFAIIGVTLFQFGVGIATERSTPWERYLRTLPAPVASRFLGRVIVAAAFGTIAASMVIVLASITAGVHFDAAQWLRIAGAMVAGGVVFTLFGLAIGYWLSEKAALPVANLFYLLLSFAGGLWIPPDQMPPFARAVSPFLPTRQFADLLWNAPFGISWSALLPLGCFGCAFLIAAAIGYRRDQKARYA